MGKQTARLLFALVLIGLGLFLLAGNLNLLPGWLNYEENFWMVAFFLGGVAFLAVFGSNVRENWWAVIPSFTLIGLSGVIGASTVLSDANGWTGGFFLAMIGLSFWVIFLVHREMWWAIIPGGVLVTLGLVAGVSELASAGGFDEGGILFIGIALTFLLLSSIRTPDGRMTWALWPAGVLGLLGIFILAGSTSLARFIWPIALVGAGAYLVARNLIVQRNEGGNR